MKAGAGFSVVESLILKKKYEIIFFYTNTRCHAMKVAGLIGGERYIGKMDGFEIWQIETGGFFDQFGFVAVREG